MKNNTFAGVYMRPLAPFQSRGRFYRMPLMRIPSTRPLPRQIWCASAFTKRIFLMRLVTKRMLQAKKENGGLSNLKKLRWWILVFPKMLSTVFKAFLTSKCLSKQYATRLQSQFTKKIFIWAVYTCNKFWSEIWMPFQYGFALQFQYKRTCNYTYSSTKLNINTFYWIPEDAGALQTAIPSLISEFEVDWNWLVYETASTAQWRQVSNWASCLL